MDYKSTTFVSIYKSNSRGKEQTKSNKVSSHLVTLADAAGDPALPQIEDFVDEWVITGPEAIDIKSTDKMRRFLKPGETSVSAQDLRSRIKKYYLD